MKYLLVFAVLLFSCNTIESTTEVITECELPHVIYGPTSVMVCHSPSSANHQTICSEECFKLGSNGAFCWAMPTEWCDLSPLEAWVEKVCQSVREESL